MRFGPCKALLCLVFGLFSCAERSDLELEYIYEGQANLDLILILGLEAGPNRLSWSEAISSLPGYLDFSEALFAQLLKKCAIYMGEASEESFSGLEGQIEDCLEMGRALGQDLFGGQELQLNDLRLALNPEIKLGGEDFLFVLFFFNSTQLQAAPRCVQLKLARRENKQFQIGDLPASDQLQIKVASPQLNLDCFAL